MSYIDKSQQWSFKKEASYGVVPTFNVVPGEDIIECVNPTMDAATDLIEREVIKNSLVMAKPIPGKETSSGSVGIEISSVIAGELNGDLLYESGMGAKIDVKASVDESGTAASNTSTTINVTAASGGNYTVGQALKVLVDATYEYVIVRSISTDELTIAPAMTGTPTLVTTVEGLISYTIAKPDTAAISFAIEEYFENASNQITYTYAGCVITDMTINYPVANIVKTDFSIAGAGFDVATAVGDRTSVCHSFDPYVAKNMTFTYAGTSYNVEDLSVNIASDVYDVEALTTDGITNKVITGKSAVGGSFGLEYEGTALFTAFKAGTTGELYGLVSNTATTAGIFMPSVIISQSSKSVDSGIYKDSADFVALSSAGCSDTIEDAATVFFG